MISLYVGHIGDEKGVQTRRVGSVGRETDVGRREHRNTFQE